MVEAGKISIGADLDTKNLDRGVARAKQGLNEVGDTANSVENDLKRAGSQAGKFGRRLATAGTIGATVLAGIAARAPATAGAMARIKVATGQLTRELGEQLAPTFDKVATGIQNLADFAEGHPVLVKFGIGAVGAAAGAAVLGKLGVGALIAALGPGGIATVIAAGASLIAGGTAGTGAASTGVFGERGQTPAVVGSAITGGLAGAATGAVTGAAIGAFGGPIGATGGILIGAILGLLSGGIAEYSKGRKDRESRNEADLN